jgi:hypothetical protein
MPLPLSSLFLLYQETKARVSSLNSTVPEQHFTQLDTILANVALIDVPPLSSKERAFLQIGRNHPSNSVWIASVPEQDWEVMWKWRPPLGAAQFTLYARGLGPKSSQQKPAKAKSYLELDPNNSRTLIRMSYVIQDVHVTPDNWIEWLDREAKPMQWRDVIRFLGFLGKPEFWKPIVNALAEGNPCIPLRTA